MIQQNYVASEISNRQDKSSFENIFDKQYENHCCEAEDIPHKIFSTGPLKELHVLGIHRKSEEIINHLSLGEGKQEEFSWIELFTSRLNKSIEATDIN